MGWDNRCQCRKVGEWVAEEVVTSLDRYFLHKFGSDQMILVRVASRKVLQVMSKIALNKITAQVVNLMNLRKAACSCVRDWGVDDMTLV